MVNSMFRDCSSRQLSTSVLIEILGKPLEIPAASFLAAVRSLVNFAVFCSLDSNAVVPISVHVHLSFAHVAAARSSLRRVAYHSLWLLMMRNAGAERDRADAHVTATVINVPAFFGSIGGAAGELGHARLKRGKGGPAIAPRFSSSDYHPKRYKLSIVESPTRTDITSVLKVKMSKSSYQKMIKHHDFGLLSQLSETHIWRHFGRERCHCSIASIKTTAASVGGE
jgi:hypothetical protein